jgi:hypothetical protein
VRTPVGQPFISEAIVDHDAVIGGEGNGSVAVPAGASLARQRRRDRLDPLAPGRAGQPLSALVAALPQVVMLKEQVPIAPNRIYSALQEFRDAVQEEAEGERRPAATASRSPARRVGARPRVEHRVDAARHRRSGQRQRAPASWRTGRAPGVRR